jgi:hypothetical protein
MSKILFHTYRPEALPVGLQYEDINRLDTYEDNSLSEIMLADTLDFYTNDQAINLIQKLSAKITKNGSLEIQGTDINQLSLAVINNNIDINTVNDVLYPMKKSISTMLDMQNLLKSYQFTITQKRYVNLFEYYILAKNEK